MSKKLIRKSEIKTYRVTHLCPNCDKGELEYDDWFEENKKGEMMYRHKCDHCRRITNVKDMDYPDVLIEERGHPTYYKSHQDYLDSKKKTLHLP